MSNRKGSYFGVALSWVLTFSMLIMSIACVFDVRSTRRELAEAKTTYDDELRAEITSIYQLLAAAGFTNRTVMNMSAKTNHYLTHPLGQAGLKPTADCEGCIDYHKHLVANMPEMSGSNQRHFERFYKQPLEHYLKQQKSN